MSIARMVMGGGIIVCVNGAVRCLENCESHILEVKRWNIVGNEC